MDRLGLDVDRGAAKSSLAGELGGTVPSLAANLQPEEVEDLTAAIAEAKQAQAKELSDAADKALQNVPRIFRGAAKKVLLG